LLENLLAEIKILSQQSRKLAQRQEATGIQPETMQSLLQALQELTEKLGSLQQLQDFASAVSENTDMLNNLKGDLRELREALTGAKGSS
ncbi:MAG: hypothetical protein ABH878_03185, partial [bacterium]